MSKNLTPKAFRHWLEWSEAGCEVGYTTESIRDEELMEIARVASDQGRVVLFRRRLNDELWLIARTVSGQAKRFLKAAPRLDGKRVYRDPPGYVPFANPSGRGLRAPTLPEGFDGPASRRAAPGAPCDDA